MPHMNIFFHDGCNTISTANDLISDTIITCYAINGGQHFYLHYRGAVFIVYTSQPEFRIRDDNRANNTAIDFGFETFVDP